jgi:hypothetical protein
MDNPNTLVTLSTQDSRLREIKQNKNQKAKKISSTKPAIEQGAKAGTSEGQEVTASHKTHVMLLIWSILVGHHYAQANTNNVNKTLLQIKGGKDEPNIGNHNTEVRNMT